jgi:GNAT superfamily N-acetyltransferase
MTVSWYPGADPGTPELTIRPVKGVDARAVAELCALASSAPWPDPASCASIRTWLEAEGEGRITLVASAGRRSVGMISMREHREMPRPAQESRRWGYVDHLFVRTDERRQGVGTALISEIMAIADSRNYPKLMASADPGTLSLFHRLGFLMTDELGPGGPALHRPQPRITD